MPSPTLRHTPYHPRSRSPLYRSPPPPNGYYPGLTHDAAKKTESTQLQRGNIVLPYLPTHPTAALGGWGEHTSTPKHRLVGADQAVLFFFTRDLHTYCSTACSKQKKKKKKAKRMRGHSPNRATQPAFVKTSPPTPNSTGQPSLPDHSRHRHTATRLQRGRQNANWQQVGAGQRRIIGGG